MWRIPSAILKGGSFSAISSFSMDASYAALGAGASYTTATFSIDFTPLFDIFFLIDVAGTAQLQTRRQTGDAWRATGAAYAALAGVVLQITGLRAPNRQARWVFTNPGGVAAVTTEIVAINRSL